MRSPELVLRDDNGREETLEEMEPIEELDSLEFAVLVTETCAALERFRIDGMVDELARVRNLLVCQALAEGSSADLAGEIHDMLEKLRIAVQEEYKKGSYSFSNEDIFAQFGKQHEEGMLLDARFIIENMEKEPGVVKDFYSLPSIDMRYDIDRIVTYRTEGAEASGLSRIDLVQITNKNVTLAERERMLKKHKDFLWEQDLLIKEFRETEASEGEVEDLTIALGDERATFIQEAWMEAATRQGETAENLRISLEGFREDVMASKAFMAAPRAVKRAYIEGLTMEKPVDPEFAALHGVFESWKEEWLSSVKPKKESVFKPLSGVQVRSVLYCRGSATEAETIGVID